MTNKEAVNWLINISADIGKAEHRDLWHYEQALYEIREMLESAQPEQHWIPCNERLPEEYGMYLVTMMEKAKEEDFGFDVDDIEVRKMRYNSNGWQIPRHIPTWINNVITDEVIAWMPLPEPYKAERREE